MWLVNITRFYDRRTLNRDHMARSSMSNYKPISCNVDPCVWPFRLYLLTVKWMNALMACLSMIYSNISPISDRTRMNITWIINFKYSTEYFISNSLTFAQLTNEIDSIYSMHPVCRLKSTYDYIIYSLFSLFYRWLAAKLSRRCQIRSNFSIKHMHWQCTSIRITCT